MRRPTLRAAVPGASRPVWVGVGLIDRIGQCLPAPDASSRCVIVSDETVAAIFGDRLATSLATAGWDIHQISLKPGERSKARRTVDAIHEALFAMHADRATPLIALGGGVVGDTAGFAAATYMRGLPLYHVPTTVIAQVDSAFGGKVGVNHRHGKNLIGAFYQPHGVIVDPETLQSLPRREFVAGLAEVVKYGIIGDRDLFAACEHNLPHWIDTRSLPVSILRRCIAMKLDIVRRDEREAGLRRVLNLGHTAGHALELAGGYRRFRHGEAVAFGLCVAANLAHRRGILSNRDNVRILALSESPLNGVRIPEADAAAEMAEMTAFDKKRRGGRAVWILPRGIGRVVIVDDVTRREVVTAIRKALQV